MSNNYNSNNMNVSQICSELDTIIHKLTNINQSCKNQEKNRQDTRQNRQDTRQNRQDTRQNRTENNMDTRDIPAAGYNGPQSNRSNSQWIGSLRNVWVRY